MKTGTHSQEASPTVVDRRVTTSGEIQLQRRILEDGSVAFEIISDGVFLMASYNQTSERALARHAIEALGDTGEIQDGDEFRVLVGGLGMGLTLQECLDIATERGYKLSATQADIVELSPAIVEWNRTHLAPVNGHVLERPGVCLIQADLHEVLMQMPASTYDVIVLDVDNGPSWLAHEQNKRLYSCEALSLWSRILNPGGVLAIWSAQPEPAFLQRMRAVFGHAGEIAIETPHLRERVSDDFVYVAKKTSTQHAESAAHLSSRGTVDAGTGVRGD